MFLRTLFYTKNLTLTWMILVNTKWWSILSQAKPINNSWGKKNRIWVIKSNLVFLRLSLVSLAHRMRHTEASHKALQSRVPRDKRRHATPQLRGRPADTLQQATAIQDGGGRPGAETPPPALPSPRRAAAPDPPRAPPLPRPDSCKAAPPTACGGEHVL